MKPSQTLAERLADLRPLLGSATLVAASKTQPAETLEEAIALGITDFGENRVQEAQAKWPELKQRHPGVTLHLIGPLQSNKAAEAVALFDVIETIDRAKIADAVMEEIEKLSSRARPGIRPSPPPASRRIPGRARDDNKLGLECYIQVNIGEEPQKGGVSPEELPALVEHCRTIGLPLTGLMCIPPVGTNPAPYFALLKKLADRYDLTQLSMGMSDDFAAAIRLGATHVRIGTRLFGARQS